MNFFRTVAITPVIIALGFSSCEKHSFDETKQLYQGHGGDHADHGDHHADEKGAHPEDTHKHDEHSQTAHSSHKESHVEKTDSHKSDDHGKKKGKAKDVGL